jgi:hypothetical protein
MPDLHDRVAQASNLHTRYDQVLQADQKLKSLLATQIPSCLRSGAPIDPAWPAWVPLARRALTITSSHKIIMIHRRFLEISFTDEKFELTRRTCLAAAESIIKELRQEFPEGSPNLWTFSAFSVAAAVSKTLTKPWSSLTK